MQNTDWSKLSFGYQKTNENVRCFYRNGKWGPLEVSGSEFISIHMASTCLHYGQEAFEGLKAFRGKDNRIRLFRWNDNWKRMAQSARGILMEEVPEDLFKEAIWKVVERNRDFVPPYGSGASLYIRPLLLGIGAEVGVKPASEFLFMVFVTPVGPYFKEGFKPVDMMLTREHDRTAPLGTGMFKIGGNYAASLSAIRAAHDGGYANVLFLDPKEKKYIDECSPANFFGIKDNTYITPESPTILPSITNKSLIQIAQDIGLKTQRRKIPFEELESFEEVGACGTAAVISPIRKIFDPEKNKIYSYGSGEPGPISLKLYNQIQAIQLGDTPDLHHWIDLVD